MKRTASVLTCLALACAASAAFGQNADRPWQRLSDPTLAELSKGFAAPPHQYSAQFDYGFNAGRTRDAVAQQLDRAQQLNVHAVFVEPTHATVPYLSAEYFDAVKVIVAEAKKRDMYLWFDDDGGYPSGFAGGKYTTERPDLRSMALTAQRMPATAGQVFTQKLSPETICILARNTATGETQVLDSSTGSVNWTVPAGDWEIIQPRFAYRSGPTRSANNAAGGKTNEHSLMDYLNPEAGRLFVQWTFDGYQNAIGNEMGNTVLGFRGDEPSIGFNPWSPVLLAEFQKRKGYDLRPHLGAIAGITLGGGGARGGAAGAGGAANLDEAHRVFADYCDVWSDLFGESFFGTEGKWAAEHHVEMQMHIEHEENLPMLASSNGDFFKCMRSIQVPGIDTIWHQIWHDVEADFPKLASSATHLNGQPRAMCEAFAAYNPVPDIKEAGWILNHLMVNGISRIEYMGLQGATPRNFYADPGFPALAMHVNRATYLLGEGRPAAQIGVYVPSSSFWFNDTASDVAFKAIVHQLLQHQRDLDFVDDYALSTTLAQQGPALVNKSGQRYRAILVPPVDALSKPALDKLHAFAAAGGKVIFFGQAPRLVVEKSFRTAAGPADISWATLRAAAEITPQVLAELPAPDVATDLPTTWLKYNHRRMKDADVYYFFNEGETPLAVKATVTHAASATQVQQWNTATGAAEKLAGVSPAAGRSVVPLNLAPWATTVIVIPD